MFEAVFFEERAGEVLEEGLPPEDCLPEGWLLESLSFSEEDGFPPDCPRSHFSRISPKSKSYPFNEGY